MTTVEAYDALGLDGARASADAVRARFRALIRAHHPDGKPVGEQPRANEATRRIVEAYTLLRTAGFPRVARSAVADAPPSDLQPTGADPLAWIDEAWRESVRRERPETALTKAVLRAAWWAFGGLLLSACGVLGVVFGFANGFWTVALLWLAIGARLGVAAWRMASEVAQFWRVFRSVAAPSTLRAVKRSVALRLGTALLLALIAGAFAIRYTAGLIFR